jgi:two-component system sensor histidine kinase HydH
MEYDIKVVIDLLAQSIDRGLAEKYIQEAVEEAEVEKKEIYSEEEFKEICECLKKKGGIVGLFAKVVNLPQYRETYFRLVAQKEKEEKEKIEILYRELYLAYEKLSHMQEELIKQEKLATIGRLAAAVGHELKNPLATIKNIAYYFKKYLSTDNDKIKTFINILDSEVNRAASIINNLLDFSKLRKLNISQFNLSEVMDTTIPFIYIPSNKKIEFKKDYPTELIVEADKDKIKQVFINLLQNAVEAISEEGQISIKMKESEDNKVFISIEDNGCGMTEEVKAKIFEPLFTTKTKGLGLGLSIVKEILLQHNGEIEVESELNKGTKIKIFLPKNFIGYPDEKEKDISDRG